MTITQPELLISELPATLPDEPEIKLLWTILAQRRDWTTAAMIIAQVQLEKEWRWSDRLVRKLAAQAAPEIISGDLGYKLLSLATPEEVRAFVGWMQGMADGINQRARAVRARRPEVFL